MAKQKIDEDLQIIWNEIQESEKKLTKVDVGREEQVENLCESIKDMVDEKNVKVSCHLHEPLESSGYISIIGKNISIVNTLNFVSVLTQANNVEIYPKTDGTVQINLMFYGLKR